jgi:hypothetical protein
MIEPKTTRALNECFDLGSAQLERFDPVALIKQQPRLALLAGEVLQAIGCGKDSTPDDIIQARHIIDCAATYIAVHDVMAPDERFATAEALLRHAAGLGWLNDPDWVKPTAEGLMMRIPSTASRARVLN